MSNIIKQLEQEQMKQDVPSFRPGDTVEVKVWVVEGSKKRLQAFEGVVIAIRNRGLHSAFTVRKISNGEGVERVFQTHSPVVDSISVRARFSRSSGLLSQVRPSDCFKRQRRISAWLPDSNTGGTSIPSNTSGRV